ncbi:hypothetical protein [Deinococcus sp. Leaf326]|uniref:hypothetical protein n=1 Tax=Deinococcus sp. Leaf326 TaxID=1736338 RepID=UPI0006F968EA|nr:hypothetical protein [Deinococcus sp. Leaf326]KQR40741.1 hypothetical protein ASF71_00810 [Deinococcus sp. Leaf326]
MNRQTLEGVWIPRADLVDWEVLIGSESYRSSTPGPISTARIQLDGIGCLASGSLALKRPRSIPRPFKQLVQVNLLSRTHGWVPVCQGILPPAKPDALNEWTLEILPLEVVDLDGYYDGRLITYNTLDPGADSYTDTNRAVVDRALKANPSASIGVDWTGAVLLARPGDGSPVQISRARWYDWKSTGEVVLPYGTESRWAGPAGWARGEYKGIERPAWAPRKAVDAGEVTYKEGVQPTGPAVVNQREVILSDAFAPAAAAMRLTTNIGPNQRLIERDLPLSQSGPTVRRVSANQYAHVSVYDLQAWFEGSALAGQDNEQLTQAQSALALADGAYNLALTTLGEGHPVTVQAAEDLADARDVVRLAQVDQVVGSFYEPLSGKLSYGFVGQNLGPGVVTGLTMWLSTVPWDEQAVGVPVAAEDNPDPDAPLSETPLEGIEGAGIVHPFASSRTLMVAEAPLGELSQASQGMPWQPSALTIPESYFRSSMKVKLAASLNARWASKREEAELGREEEGTLPDIRVTVGQRFSQSFGAGAGLQGALPPGLSFDGGLLHGAPTAEGEFEVTIGGQKHVIWVYGASPGRGWAGRWYFHVAAWWQIIFQEETQAN